MPAHRPVADRLLSFGKLDLETHCVEFTGHICKDGYGKMNGGKEYPGETLVHRLAYMVWVGNIPKGMEIDHRCENRRCYNPQHLGAITHAQNVRLADCLTNHRNRVKTHCMRGHPLFGSNLYVEPKSKARKCRICNKAKMDRTNARAKEKRLAAKLAKGFKTPEYKIKKALMEACHGIVVKEV